MLRFYHNYFLDKGNYYPYFLSQDTVDPYELECVKKYDNMLHETLSEIFRERSSLSRDQIKKLLRATNDNTIILQILRKELSLRWLFTKNQKLSLLWSSVLAYFHKSAELLVRLGADVNELCERPICDKFDEKTTILHLLLKMYPSSWNERMIALVITHGADLQARDTNGQTILHCAAYRGRVQVASWLLLEKKPDVDVNAVDNEGSTALLEAASTPEADEMLPLLIEHGADVTRRDKNGRNALHNLAHARGVEHADLARLLIEKGTSIDDRDNVGDQPINVATYAGINKLVKILLDYGANVNAQGQGNECPLYLAARAENPELLLTLLKRGANIDLKARIRSDTALHLACEMAQIRNIKILLTIGADIFVENRDGNRPLDLVNPKDEEKVKTILRTLVLKKTTFPQPSIEWIRIDQLIRARFPKSRNYYEDCIAEIEQMKSARFIRTCSLFDLLTKCMCEVAVLMRNRNFESKFWQYNLKFFPAYAGDVTEAFERAYRYYDFIIQREKVIDKAFYNTLPHIIVRKVVHYSINCKICEMKETVRASRRRE